MLAHHVIGSTYPYQVLQSHTSSIFHYPPPWINYGGSASGKFQQLLFQQDTDDVPYN